MAIQILRGNSTTRASSERVLEVGQPLYETDTNKLYVGDGTTQAKNLPCVTTDRIKTSDARPKAEVKSGATTATKEMALLEDVGNETAWASGVSGNLVLYGKGAGVYQIKLNVEGSPCCFAYWDGTSDYGYCSSYVSMQLDADGFWLFNYEFYIEAKQIKCKHYAYKMNSGTVTKEIDRLTTSFTYRKITN